MNTPDQFNVYTDTDGSKYFIQPDQSVMRLQYYNPTSGDYAEVGDNTVYNNAGEDTGQVFNGSAVVSGANSGGTSWLDILNTGLGAAGSIFGSKSTTTTTAQYTPIGAGAAPVSSTGTVWKVLGVLAVVGAAVFVVVKVSKKKGKAAAAAK